MFKKIKQYLYKPHPNGTPLWIALLFQHRLPVRYVKYIKRKPGWLEITTMIGCKVRCVYCPQDKFVQDYLKSTNPIQMSFDTFKKYLDKIPKGTGIHFSGMGEPWLNPDCTKMLVHAHNRGFKIRAYTTLTGMNLSDINKIKFIPFQLFEVHIPDIEGLMRIDINKNYLQLIEKINKSNIQNTIFMAVGGKPHPKLKKFVVKNIGKNLAISRANNVKNVKIRGPAKIKGTIKCSRWGNDFKGNILLPNGDVLLCCMDYGMKHILGNLLVLNYNSLFKSKEYYRLQEGLKDDSIDILCRRCECAIKM